MKTRMEDTSPLLWVHNVSGPQSVLAGKAGSSCLPLRERLGHVPMQTAIYPGVKRRDGERTHIYSFPHGNDPEIPACPSAFFQALLEWGPVVYWPGLGLRKTSSLTIPTCTPSHPLSSDSPGPIPASKVNLTIRCSLLLAVCILPLEWKHLEKRLFVLFIAWSP